MSSQTCQKHQALKCGMCRNCTSWHNWDENHEINERQPTKKALPVSVIRIIPSKGSSTPVQDRWNAEMVQICEDGSDGRLETQQHVLHVLDSWMSRPGSSVHTDLLGSNVAVVLHTMTKRRKSLKWTVKMCRNQRSAEINHAPPTSHCRGFCKHMLLVQEPREVSHSG